jgi:hypothetical protein
MNFFTSEMPNTKLTVEQRELLVCLMEEAAEVTQVITKILRFGYTSSPLLSDVTNAERLQREVADFLGIVDRLIELELFSAVALDEGAEAKLLKLENYLLFKGDTDIV